MKSKEAEQLAKATFWAPKETHRLFQDHCEAIGVSFWRGFAEAVHLWVEQTQDKRLLTKKKA